MYLIIKDVNDLRKEKGYAEREDIDSFIIIIINFLHNYYKSILAHFSQLKLKLFLYMSLACYKI